MVQEIKFSYHLWKLFLSYLYQTCVCYQCTSFPNKNVYAKYQLPLNCTMRY